MELPTSTIGEKGNIVPCDLQLPHLSCLGRKRGWQSMQEVEGRCLTARDADNGASDLVKVNCMSSSVNQFN